MGQQFAGPAAVQVGLEELVGIVKIGEHQVEAFEVIHPGRIEHGARHEEGAERPAIDRAHGVEVKTARTRHRIGQRGLAQQLEMGVGPALAQQPQRRQRDEEIAQRAAANDQDSHLHAGPLCRKNRGEASAARTGTKPRA